MRGLSDRDIESLAKEAELGHISKTTVSRICRELRDRYTAFCNKSLADINVMAVFLDAVYLPTRPSGQKEGVLVAWGYTTEGKRVLVAVRLGQRESHEDWLDLGRDLTRRGLPPPWLVVSDGAPGLIKAIQELWPESDRGRCAVHKLRNVIAKLPKRPGLHDQVRLRTGRRWMTPLTRQMPNDGCANWSLNWSDPIRVRQRAWLKTCRRCASISRTSRGCASGFAHRICWSAHWRKSNGGPK